MKTKYFIKVCRRFDIETGRYIPYLKTWYEEDAAGNLIFKSEALEDD